MFYGFEKRFYADAKYAEMGFAKVRVKMVRIKAALIGGKLQIARLCLSLLPLLVLAIPMGGAQLATNQFEKSITFGIFGLYTAFSDGTLNLVSAIKSAPAVSQVATALFNAYMGLAAVAVCALLVLLLSALCFLGAKVMARLVCAVCLLGEVCSIELIFLENSFTKAVQGLVFTTETKSSLITLIGGVIAFAIVFALNIGIARKGIAVEYKEGDLYRVEMAKKLKKGEITLDDISQPVYETEEERVTREKAIQDILDEQRKSQAAAAEPNDDGQNTEVTEDE